MTVRAASASNRAPFLPFVRSVFSTAADRHRTWLYVIPVFVVAFGLGAAWLDRDTMWLDEHATIVMAQFDSVAAGSPFALWNVIAEDDPDHPPLYYMLVNRWAALGGDELASLRAVSLFAGMLAIAFTYRLGRDLVSPRVGLYGAVVLASSALYVIYLHEARVYALTALAATFTLWVYLYIGSRRREPGWLVWLALFLGAASIPYLNYHSTIIVIAIAGFHLLQKPRNRRWWRVWLALALAGLSFVPWLTVLVSRASTRRPLPFDLDGVAQSFVYVFSNGNAILLVPVLILLVFARPRRRFAVLAYFAIACVVLFVLANVVKSVLVLGRLRYLMFVWPLLCLLVGGAFAGVDRWGRAPRWLGPGLVLIWAALGLSAAASGRVSPHVDGQEPRLPIHHIVRALEPRHLYGDPLVHYLPDAVTHGTQQQQDRWHYADLAVTSVIAAPNDHIARDAVDAMVWDSIGEGRLRFWLATRPDMETSGLAGFQSQVAGRGYELCETAIDRADLRLALLALSPVCCFTTPPAAATHRFGDGIEIVATDLIPTVTDGRLAPGVAWRLAPSVPANTYSVSYQVRDATNSTVAQVDQGLSNFSYACSQPQIPVSDLSSGTYSLWVAVYDWQTLARLPGQDLTNGGVSDLLELGSFEIMRERQP